MDISHKRTNEVVKAVHQVTSDMVTPDHECGPRRIYQKTEIVDGEKRIEILEIVECLDSSSSSSSSYDSSELSRQKSKIPVPIQSAHRRQLRSRQSSSSTESSSSRPSSKVDQMIADLLIEALHHPKDMGIEFVRSPKESLRNASGKRMSLSRRIAMPTVPRRSANSAKYHQVFEVIPEEKSSLSVDSSNDEAPKNSEIGDSHPRMHYELSSESFRSNGISPGKAAIENEFTESEAWVGFLRHHDEGDSGNEGMKVLFFKENTLIYFILFKMFQLNMPVN